jgi:hypothetical protein
MAVYGFRVGVALSARRDARCRVLTRARRSAPATLMCVRFRDDATLSRKRRKRKQADTDGQEPTKRL